MSDEALRAVGREICFDAKPEGTFAAGTYAGTEGGDEAVKGEGVYAAAGVGYVREENGLVSAEAKGPNAGVGGAFSKEAGVRIMTKAELGSASLSAGNVTATVGLSADTGVGVGPSGVEAKLLGTGFSIGREVGFSVLGSGFKFKLW